MSSDRYELLSRRFLSLRLIRPDGFLPYGHLPEKVSVYGAAVWWFFLWFVCGTMLMGFSEIQLPWVTGRGYGIDLLTLNGTIGTLWAFAWARCAYIWNAWASEHLKRYRSKQGFFTVPPKASLRLRFLRKLSRYPRQSFMRKSARLMHALSMVALIAAPFLLFAALSYGLDHALVYGRGETGLNGLMVVAIIFVTALSCIPALMLNAGFGAYDNYAGPNITGIMAGPVGIALATLVYQTNYVTRHRFSQWDDAFYAWTIGVVIMLCLSGLSSIVSKMESERCSCHHH